MSTPKYQATIKQLPNSANGWFYVVETDEGETHHLRGIGAPDDGAVGDRGTIQYQSSGNLGVYCWSKAAC